LQIPGGKIAATGVKKIETIVGTAEKRKASLEKINVIARKITGVVRTTHRSMSGQLLKT
jgi:hypothetical protein